MRVYSSLERGIVEREMKNGKRVETIEDKKKKVEEREEIKNLKGKGRLKHKKDKEAFKFSLQ